MYVLVRWVNIVSCNGLLPEGTKPLPEPMLTCGQLDPEEQTSVKFESKDNYFFH